MSTPFDRRQFLAGGAGVIAAGLFAPALRAAIRSASTVPPAPVARIEIVRDTYFGETLADPYRWMENDKDPDRPELRYVAEQNGYGEEPEWGAIGEETGYRALRAIDSYQSVKDGARYPRCF